MLLQRLISFSVFSWLKQGIYWNNKETAHKANENAGKSKVKQVNLSVKNVHGTAKLISV